MVMQTFLTADNKKMHPSRKVGRFDSGNLSSRPGDFGRYLAKVRGLTYARTNLFDRDITLPTRRNNT